MPPRFVAQQLSNPKGILGRLMGWLMNRGNAKMNAFAVDQLELAPADRVLEIGFGGGVTLPTLLARAGFVAGVDRSRTMVDKATATFAREITAGRADFREGVIEALPFDAGSFGKVCTVNTIYFWRSLEAGCAEIHRVITPGGRAAIGFLPKERMDRLGLPLDIFTSRAPEDVVTALRGAGFTDARVARPAPETPWNVVVASR